MVAVRVSKLFEGVNTALRVTPVPLMALKLPLVKCTSPVVPSHVKVLPGSSLNVKVMLAVSPILSWLTSDVMANVGAVVSTL